jgi:hypothetical protein
MREKNAEKTRKTRKKKKTAGFESQNAISLPITIILLTYRGCHFDRTKVRSNIQKKALTYSSLTGQ